MDYQKIRDDEDFHVWNNYEPNDSQYTRYAESFPSLIATGHKIVDTYYSFANARASFMDAGAENFGDISGEDDFSKTYAKSHFLTCAIMEYSICMDMSWQVIWAYFQSSSLSYLLQDRFKQKEKECTSGSVHYRINTIITREEPYKDKAAEIKKKLTKFECDRDVKNLRELNNSIKHHGIIHIVGLGSNDKNLMMNVNGKTISRLHRQEYTLEQLEDMLYKYHFKFKNYFNDIISLLIPDDYLESTVSFVDYINAMLRMGSTSE